MCLNLYVDCWKKKRNWGKYYFISCKYSCAVSGASLGCEAVSKASVAPALEQVGIDSPAIASSL